MSISYTQLTVTTPFLLLCAHCGHHPNLQETYVLLQGWNLLVTKGLAISTGSFH